MSAREKVELWKRRKRGESLSDIGRALGRIPGAVHHVVSARGGIPPPSRTRSRRSLTLTEREEISRGLARGYSVRQIGVRLSRAPSTISREVRRNGGRRQYRASVADARAWDRARRPKPCRLALSPLLRALVAEKLAADWSPQQIAGWLKRTFPKDPCLHVSHETIYLSLFVQSRGVLKKALNAHLRRRRRMRRSKHASTAGQCRGQIIDAVSIRERPAEAADRAARSRGSAVSRRSSCSTRCARSCCRTSAWAAASCLGAQLAISVNNCPPPRDPRSRMTSFKRTQRKYVQKAYRVRNWREYETGLRARGSLTVWLGLTDGKLANWNSPRPTRRKPGRQRQYSNHAIETTVTLGLVFGLASRQTEGFLRSLLTLLNLDNDVPDHSTISRRKARLGKVASYERRTVKPVHLRIDSSGLSVHVGQWRTRRKPGTPASCTSLWMSKPVTWSPASSRASGLETLPGWRHSSARSSVPSPRPRPTPRTTPATSIRRWSITVLIDRRRC